MKRGGKMKNVFNLFVSIVSTILTFVFGGWDVPIQILTAIVLLDYLTGMLKAIFNKDLNSEVGLKGIIKKIGYFVLVAVATITDKITGNTGTIRTLVIYFFVANESLSILENWGKIGLPIPKKLTNILEQLKNDNGKDDKE